MLEKAEKARQTFNWRLESLENSIGYSFKEAFPCFVQTFP